MITAFIPSKDRAAQLDILLNSLKRLSKLEIDKVVVLYKASNPQYLDGYCKLSEYHKNIKWVYDDNFYEDFFRALDECDEYVLGLTDDTYVYRECPFTLKEFKDVWAYDNLCMSLRLGLNTIVQDIENPSKLLRVPLDNTISFPSGTFYEWNWQKESIDYNTGYPISLDGHIYRKDVLTNLSKAVEFKNLREWEGNLVYYTRDSVKSLDKMFCWEKSLTVNIPINMVQPPYIEKVSPFSIHPMKMNQLFLDGERFDIDLTDDIIGSHQYLPLKRGIKL